MDKYKLKTIKEIEAVCAEMNIKPVDGIIPGKTGIVHIDNLKQLAIKWINNMQPSETELPISGIWLDKNNYTEDMREVIMFMHNITDEDLK